MTSAAGASDLTIFVQNQQKLQTNTKIADACPILLCQPIGSPSLPLVIEYASFTCPHCAKFHSDVYPELKADYIDKGLVKFIYREVYFDKYGMWASMIARCAGPEKFFGMTDQIYRKQSDWARAESDIAIVSKLRKIGLLAGLDEEKLNSCLQDSGKLRALVEWYSENAKRDGIKSTPTFLINGEKHSNQSYEQLKEILDEILEKS